MGTHSAQSSSNMQGLLVLASIAVTSAQVISYGALGGYHGLPIGLPYAHNVIKPVIKEIEVPVETIKFVAAETGCTNSFGHAVPCAARKKRQADEAVAVEAEAAPAEAAAPAAAVLPYGLPFGYAGLGYHGLGYPGLTYAALPAPTVTEVEVPQYKFIPKEKVVELQPACQNAWGFGVPCA